MNEAKKVELEIIYAVWWQSDDVWSQNNAITSRVKYLPKYKAFMGVPQRQTKELGDT